jgi:Phosphotransferase enzyme family
MELSADLVGWIESTIGGRIVSVERQGRWRPHFFVDVKRPDGEVVSALVRFPRDPELIADRAFLTKFDIGHEARVLSALQGMGFPVARYYGFHEGEQVILQGRVAGTNDLSGLDDETRSRVLHEYIDNLHRLHTLPVDPARLPGIFVPKSAEEVAFAEFQYMEKDFRAAQAHLRPEPLLEFALWWLHANVPERTEPRWVQGDTGPGQFMVHDGKISALIDWELSHLGDPIGDLGVMRMRNLLYPVGSGLREYIDYYGELAGSPVNPDVLCYYTVMHTLMSPLGMADTIQDPDAGVGTMLPRFGWDVTLRRGLVEALCEAHGVDVAPPPLPESAEQSEPSEPPRTDLHRFLVAHLEQQCLPIAHDEYESFLLRGALGVARSVELTARVGAALEADDLADMARVLGTPVTDREAGLAAVNQLVKLDPAGRTPDLLWLFSRMERRQDYLRAPMMIAQKSHPFERLYPATRVITGQE